MALEDSNSSAFRIGFFIEIDCHLCCGAKLLALPAINYEKWMNFSAIREQCLAGGLVMWPLLLCSILSVTLASERAIFWSRIYRRQKQVAHDVLWLYQLNNMVSAIDKLK